jgi:hypothetical protein
MDDIPGHSIPPYSEAALGDSLFHYTTADGLVGILSNNEIWATAYYCVNDETELAAGRGVLAPLFRKATHEMIETTDARVITFQRRGVDVRTYADQFEQTLSSMALSSLCAYITSFCSPSNKENFEHGLLSQWRGYGADGGYALQFSRTKLLKAIEIANKVDRLNFELQDVYYTRENPMKAEVLRHSDAFMRSYSSFLDEVAKPIDLSRRSMGNPIAGLTGGPLEAFLDYLVHTKSNHFAEERECRLSLIEVARPNASSLPVHYFNRSGLIVPYVKTTASFNVGDCVEWIVIGPSPRMASRFKSTCNLVARFGRDIKVRPSHIPFTRT